MYENKSETPTEVGANRSVAIVHRRALARDRSLGAGGDVDHVLLRGAGAVVRGDLSGGDSDSNWRAQKAF